MSNEQEEIRKTIKTMQRALDRINELEAQLQKQSDYWKKRAAEYINKIEQLTAQLQTAKEDTIFYMMKHGANLSDYADAERWEKAKADYIGQSNKKYKVIPKDDTTLFDQLTGDDTLTEEQWQQMTEKQKADFIADYATGKIQLVSEEQKGYPNSGYPLSEEQLQKEAADKVENLSDIDYKDEPMWVKGYIAGRRQSDRQIAEDAPAEESKCTFPKCDCEIYNGGEGTSFPICKLQQETKKYTEEQLWAIAARKAGGDPNPYEGI